MTTYRLALIIRRHRAAEGRHVSFRRAMYYARCGLATVRVLEQTA